MAQSHSPIYDCIPATQWQLTTCFVGVGDESLQCKSLHAIAAPHNHLLPTLPWLHELQCMNAYQSSSKMNKLIIFLKCGWLHSFAVQRRMWWGFQFSMYRIDSYAACYKPDIKKTKQENSILMLLSNFHGKFTASILIIVYKMQLYPTK